jgi:hypothetical protein
MSPTRRASTPWTRSSGSTTPSPGLPIRQVQVGWYSCSHVARSHAASSSVPRRLGDGLSSSSTWSLNGLRDAISRISSIALRIASISPGALSRPSDARRPARTRRPWRHRSRSGSRTRALVSTVRSGPLARRRQECVGSAPAPGRGGSSSGREHHRPARLRCSRHVHRAGAAEHPASREIQPPSEQGRLGLRQVVPVLRALEQRRECGGRLHPEVPVPAARLEQEHGRAGRAQPVGQDASARAGATTT